MAQLGFSGPYGKLTEGPCCTSGAYGLFFYTIIIKDLGFTIKHFDTVYFYNKPVVYAIFAVHYLVLLFINVCLRTIS